MTSSQGSPSAGFSVVPIALGSHPVVVEELPPRSLGAALTERVAELFAAECRDREARGQGSELYDAELFSLVEDPSLRLRGRFVAYSEWVAQLREPALREDLGVRPLGVTGAIVCGDAVWLGLRSPSTFLLPGQWELCPSGGVDLDARSEAGEVEPTRQLELELEQELGWPRDRIESAIPFAFVEDLDLGVVDIAYRLVLFANADELRAAVQARENREYERIEGVPLASLAGFIGEHRAKVSAVSIAMLEAGGWLRR